MTSGRSWYVAIVGPGEGASNDAVADAATVGRLIAERGWITLTGGRAIGVMAAAAAGASAAGGTSVGILPDAHRAGAAPGLSIALATGLGEARNAVLVTAADALIACGLNPGTLAEIALAIRARKPIALVRPDATAVALFESMAASGMLYVADTPAEAVAWLAEDRPKSGGSVHVPRLLTVSGSLRVGSSNGALLSAVARLAPVDVSVIAYAGLATLPAFSPDVEEGTEPLPESVRDWRGAIAAADAVLISSPEYAHGIPGALKNALDWIVGGSEIVGKPVGVLSASAASRFAHPQLIEVLQTMSADVVPEATVVVDIPRRGVDADHLVADPKSSLALRSVVAALLARFPTQEMTVP